MVTNLACRPILRCASKKFTPLLAIPSIPQLPRTWELRGSTNGWRQQRTASTSHHSLKNIPIADSLTQLFAEESLLNALNIAVNRSDIAQVWTLHVTLVAKGWAHRIGPVNINNIHDLVSKEIDKGESELSAERLEDLMIFCAVIGSTDALRRVMLGYLEKGEASSAIKLFERFKVLSCNTLPEDSSSFETVIVAKWLASNGADLQALAIAAHAICGTFEDALQTILQALHPRLSNSRMIKVVQELELSQDIQERTLKYTSALEMASLVSQPDAFRARIRNLIEPRSEEQLKKICLQLAAGFDGELAWATAEEKKVSRSRPVLVRDTIWATLIRALVVCRYNDLAGRLWSKMIALGITPTVAVWHALLDGYRETQQFARLLSAWNSMVQSGIKPDAALHCSRILALFDSGKKTQAMSAFEEFKRDTKEVTDGNIVVHNAVIRGLLKAQDLDGALALLKTMSTGPLKPDIITFNTFIQYHAKRGDMQSVLFTLRDISEAGIAPDVVTFTTIHVALLKAGQANATEGMLEVMKQMGIKPNIATYSAMLDQYVKDGTSEGIRLGRELLEKMEKTPGARPNEITYTSFFMGLHRNFKLSQEEVADTTQEILQRMERRGIRVKLGMYHILLKGALSNLRPDGGLAAFQNYYRMMVKKRIKFAHDTWYIILSGLIRRNEWGLAKVMVDDMLKSGFQPMWGVQDMVRSVRQRQSNPSSRQSANKRPFV